ncbi:MAG: glycogen synthase GlgA [Ruminococcaceae bacterium]|nr:glycogen synthase GlgA [Oscillospiraceae bacterium]
MKILFVSTEVHPFIKTGGLADVAYALPKALRAAGVDVRVILPKYGDISENFTSKMNHIASYGVKVGWRNQYCGLEYLNYEDVPVYFIDNEYYFKRPGCYGFYDDGERFAYFCRSVMESVCYMDDFYPDIIHCNDWHTGMIPLYLKDVYFEKPEFAGTKSVFTIHNLQYQGKFSPAIIEDLLGLNPGYYTEDKIKYNDCVSFMKAGIVYADKVTTVSETYAKEIQTQYFGEGLDGLLTANSHKLVGILNGIDYDTHSPKLDKNLAMNFTSRSIGRKAVNKADLQKAVGLPVNPDVPVVGMITRLVRQKGIDLVTCVMEEILKLDLQFVILGTGDTDYQDFFEYYAYSYPGKIAACMKFDNSLASKIYAGSDLFLMPSLFEPCGLSQIISMSYGTLPLVRETGGLKDTVIPYNEYTGEGNGFSFANYNAHEMLNVLQYALVQFENKEVWTKLVKSAMNTRYGRERQAKAYMAVYNELIG